ncbi:uncharacterized protein LOC100180842 [Ciona intestinalis]
MEFDFNINHLFPDKITLVGENTSYRKHANSKILQRNLQIVIEVLGQRSARAQQLTGSITTLLKSQLNNQRIYVLKEANANNGLGCAIGFLKIGKKRLFVLDRDGNHNEMNPLCVLDFYVHESQQRKGCGLCLFKHMLHVEGVKASHLAIDRPSHKFISFLKKHFNLWATVPQVNNFVIFDGFFKNRSDTVRNNNSRSEWNNPQFRPLSRAVSDDIIKRNRQSDHTVMSTALKDIRPVSGSELYANHFLPSQRNNRRQKWNNGLFVVFIKLCKLICHAFLKHFNTVTNISSNMLQQCLVFKHSIMLYKQTALLPLFVYCYQTQHNVFRFSHDVPNKVNGLPPLPPNRRDRFGDNDVVTNPYRRNFTNQNGHVKGDVLQGSQMTEKRDMREELRAKDNALPGIAPNQLEESRVRTNTQEVTENSYNGMNKHSSPVDQLKCNNLSHDQKSPKVTRKPATPPHLKPSNIIDELKAKDAAYLSNRNLTTQNQSRLWYQRQLQGTRSSWNVLGVPTRPFWNAQ